MDDQRWQTVEAWMEQYGDMVLQTIYLMTHDREASEEVAQEVFIRAYRKLHQFRGGSRPSTWLYRIAVNMARNHLRRRREVVAEREFLETAAGPSNEFRPDNTVEEAEEKNRIIEEVSGLPLELRTVVSLYYLDELSVEKTAEVLRIPAGTVKSRLSRARRKLRSALTGEDAPGRQR